MSHPSHSIPLVPGRARAFFLSLLLSFILFGVVAALLRFPVIENDFWGALYYGRHLTWADKASLYNGFFPIGYAFLLRLLPYGQVILWAFLVNLLFGAAFIAAVTCLVTAFDRRAVWAVSAFALAISYPTVFRYSLVIGADMGAASLATLAVFFLWKDPLAGRESDARLSPFLAGGLLGLSTLWRGHLVVFSLAVILGFWLFQKPSFAYVWKLLAAFLVVASLQAILNLLSGHGPLETAQAFNIYKTFHNVDWRNPPSDEQVAQFSLLDLIARRPEWFFARYKLLLSPLLPLSLPSIFLLLVSKNPILARFAKFSIMSIVLYSLPVALGGSPRASLPLVGLFLPSALFMWMAFLERFRTFARFLAPAAALLFVVALLLFWPRNAAFFRETRKADEVPRRVERILLRAGLQSPRQVFTDRYNLYFHIPPYEPRYNGGWGIYSLWGYEQENPELPMTTFEEFRAACAEQGIKYLVLSPKADILSDFLYEVYLADGNDALELIGTSGNLKVFWFQ